MILQSIHLFTGKAKGCKARCSYTKFAANGFAVVNMPLGVDFKTPGSYGPDACRAILAAKDDIMFSEYSYEYASKIQGTVDYNCDALFCYWQQLTW